MRIKNLIVVLFIAGILTSAEVLVYTIPKAQADTGFTISDVNVSFQDRSVVVAWKTNLPSDARIDFGVDLTYGTYFISSGQLLTDHSMALGGLESERAYHFKLTSRSAAGESVSTFDRTFKTIKLVDQIAPLISNVHIVYVTGTSATLQWETDEAASSLISYGKTAAYGWNAGNGWGTKLHDITLGGLSTGTYYHVQVSSQDSDGNISTYSDLTFTTLLNGEPDKSPLVLADVKPVSLNDPAITTDSAVISWQTNKLATTLVYYGSNNAGDNAIQPQILRNFFHSVQLTQLKPGTNYYYIVASTDVFGSAQQSDTYSFRTKDAPVTTPQYLVQVPGRPVVLGFTTVTYTKPTALYRLQATPDIYAIFQNQKYHVPNVYSLRLYTSLGLSIQDASQSTLDAIPNVRLVKASNSNAVYYLYQRSGNRFLKLQLPNPTVFMSYPRNKWDAIVALDPSDLRFISNAALLKVDTSPDIYVLENNTKHLIISERAFQQAGYTYENVVGVNQTHLDNYPTGGMIE